MTFLAAFLPLLPGGAQDFSDAALDSMTVVREKRANNYLMAGVQYGYSLLNTDFIPVRDTRFWPNARSFGFTLTKHYAMTGIFGAFAETLTRAGLLPYFGFQTGFLYGHEGFKFKKNKETGLTPTLDYATATIMEAVEVPLMMQLYLDMGVFKLLFPELGLYGGYRYSIERIGEGVDPDYRYAFRPVDRQWEYGFRAGAGFALAFDPVEIHLKATLKFALQSLYDPDYYSRYYYRFAYPYDITVSLGVHYQLTRRQGRTRKQLAREAYRMVYEPAPQEEETP